MKKHRYNKILTAVGLFSLSALSLQPLLSSCSDSFLDKDPDERVKIDSEEKVVKLLVSAYPSANYALMCEMSADNLIDNNAPHYPADEHTTQVLAHYNLSSYNRGDDELFKFEAVKSSTSSDSPTEVWEGYYNSIATANAALEAIEEIASKTGMTSTLKAARAEALLIRAYSHFILVNIFSQAYKDEEASKKDIGIPYVTETEEKVLVHYDRGTVADVYAKIGEDLEAGLEDITDDNYQMPKYHFNVAAAHAFAARYYLFTRQYDKVIENADIVLGTDSAATAAKLMRWDTFTECTYGSDYANVWQEPDDANNLMLITTYSIFDRHLLGYRYSYNSLPLRNTIYHLGPNWLWYVMPCCYVGGYLFYSGDTDYGFYPMKNYEQFEYTDKIAGIGYAHIIRREFTCNELLLERAEAKIMTARYDEAWKDLQLYDNSRWTFDEESAKTFFAQGALSYLTKSVMLSWYSKDSHPNCFADWDFTQNMSGEFVVPADAVPYMNCLNDFRRFEILLDGQRFFDLKRYGIEYTHVVGLNSEEYTLTWDDPRRALEVPQEVIAAGLEASRPDDEPDDGASMAIGRE